MPIGNVNKEPAVKRETFRPPWVKDKDAAAPPPWMQKKLKPVESTTKPEAEEAAPASAVPAAKTLKRKYFCQYFTTPLNERVYYTFKNRSFFKCKSTFFDCHFYSVPRFKRQQ